MTAEEYERIALVDPERPWELHSGRLREKPGMAWDHTDILSHLSHLLQLQLNRDEFRVHLTGSRLRGSTENYYIPDVAVVPLHLATGLRGRRDRLEVYRDPLPLVVEVWSPSTGDYDVDAKLPAYQERGDLEIWRLHPYERTLTAWRRQSDGTYAETVYHGGMVQPAPLPDVAIDLDLLFDA